MSKRIITAILLLAFLIFNLTACFDTDDLFDNVIAPEGSVPENTEKSTVIEPTEKPTEETEPVIQDEPENIPYPLTTQTATVSCSSAVTDDYSEPINAINALIKVANGHNDETTQPYQNTLGIPDTNFPIKAAYNCQQGLDFGALKFGEWIDTYPGMHLTAYKNFYVIEGATVWEEHKNSVFIIASYHKGTALRSIDYISFENGKLTIDINFFAYANRDDGMNQSYIVIELDKSILGDDKIESLDINFNCAFINLKITNNETNETKEEEFRGGWREDYIFDSIIGQNASWSDRIDGSIEFDYTIEIIETELIGYEDEYMYTPLFKPTDEKRVIKYNSELGICVEGNRSLQLTDSENEYFKSIVSQVN